MAKLPSLIARANEPIIGSQKQRAYIMYPASRDVDSLGVQRQTLNAL